MVNYGNLDRKIYDAKVLSDGVIINGKKFKREIHMGNLILVPAEDKPQGYLGPMYNGSQAFLGDGLFGAELVDIHNRYETQEEYDILSR